MAILIRALNNCNRHRWKPFRRWAWIWLFWLVLLSALPGTQAWSADFSPNQVRAAFIYNLANFVEWPVQDGRIDEPTFVIAVIGNDEIYQNLKTLAKDEYIKKKSIEVKRFVTIDNVNNCQILFIGTSTTVNMINILKVAAGLNTLTVGAADGFVDLGGMVNLRDQGRRIQIEINIDAAQKVGIKFNAKLLQVATVVGSNH